VGGSSSSGNSNLHRTVTKLWHRRVLIGVALAACAVVVAFVARRPRNDRTWSPEHAVMPRAELRGDSVVLRRMRDFTHESAERFEPGYADRAYDLSKLESVWFIVTPFSRHWRGPAHTFVSFGFADSQYVAISVEARREPGESYGPLTGLFKRFELIYVVGDERDLIGSRAAFGDFDVYVYPVRTTPERMRALFIGMLERANGLAERPEFYNTLTNNCTSNVVAHVNSIVPRRVPHGIKTVLPGYTDEVAHSLGLIDNTISLDEARRRYRVNERARQFVRDAHFSQRIREVLAGG
jgi:hypothetical protein